MKGFGEILNWKFREPPRRLWICQKKDYIFLFTNLEIKSSISFHYERRKYCVCLRVYIYMYIHICACVYMCLYI